LAAQDISSNAIALTLKRGGVGSLRPPFLARRTPMRSIGHGALARRVGKIAPGNEKAPPDQGGASTLSSGRQCYAVTIKSALLAAINPESRQSPTSRPPLTRSNSSARNTRAVWSFSILPVSLLLIVVSLGPVAPGH